MAQAASFLGARKAVVAQAASLGARKAVDAQAASWGARKAVDAQAASLGASTAVVVAGLCAAVCPPEGGLSAAAQGSRGLWRVVIGYAANAVQ